MRFFMIAKQSAIAGVAVASLFAVTPVSAGSITYSIGNQQYINANIAADDLNVLSAVGDIGNTGFQMTFNTMMGPYPLLNTTQVAMHCQHGVAFCESQYDSTRPTADHTGFSSITLSAVGNTAWTAGDFSLDLLGQTNGTVTFTAYLDGALVAVNGFNSFIIDATGQNPYNFITFIGDIDQLVITTTSPFNLADIKQVSLQAVAVPEPATLALFGVGLAALGGLRTLRRYRKRNA